MPITVRRQTRFNGSLAPFRLLLNGQAQAEIYNQEELSLDCPPGQHQLAVWKSRGSRIQVTEGDKILISDHPARALTFWAGTLLILASNLLLEPGSTPLSILTGIGAVSLVVSFLFPKVKLSKIA